MKANLELSYQPNRRENPHIHTTVSFSHELSIKPTAWEPQELLFDVDPYRHIVRPMVGPDHQLLMQLCLLYNIGGVVSSRILFFSSALSGLSKRRSNVVPHIRENIRSGTLCAEGGFCSTAATCEQSRPFSTMVYRTRFPAAEKNAAGEHTAPRLMPLRLFEQGQADEKVAVS